MNWLSVSYWFGSNPSDSSPQDQAIEPESAVQNFSYWNPLSWFSSPSPSDQQQQQQQQKGQENEQAHESKIPVNKKVEEDDDDRRKVTEESIINEKDLGSDEISEEGNDKATSINESDQTLSEERTESSPSLLPRYSRAPPAGKPPSRSQIRGRKSLPSTPSEGLESGSSGSPSRKPPVGGVMMMPRIPSDILQQKARLKSLHNK